MSKGIEIKVTVAKLAEPENKDILDKVVVTNKLKKIYLDIIKTNVKQTLVDVVFYT